MLSEGALPSIAVIDTMIKSHLVSEEFVWLIDYRLLLREVQSRNARQSWR